MTNHTDQMILANHVLSTAEYLLRNDRQVGRDAALIAAAVIEHARVQAETAYTP